MPFGNTKQTLLGTLEVRPIAGRDLKEKDPIGKQDPFLEVVCGGEKHHTKADKRGGRKPQWNDILRFDIYESSKELNIKVNAATLRDTKYLGECTVELKRVFAERQHDAWFPVVDRGRESGQLYIEMTFIRSGEPVVNPQVNVSSDIAPVVHANSVHRPGAQPASKPIIPATQAATAATAAASVAHATADHPPAPEPSNNISGSPNLGAKVSHYPPLKTTDHTTVAPYPPTTAPSYPPTTAPSYPPAATTAPTGSPSIKPVYPPANYTDSPSSSPAFRPVEHTGSPSIQPAHPPKKHTGSPSIQPVYPPKKHTKSPPNPPAYPPHNVTPYLPVVTSQSPPSYPQPPAQYATYPSPKITGTYPTSTTPPYPPVQAGFPGGLYIANATPPLNARINQPGGYSDMTGGFVLPPSIYPPTAGGFYAQPSGVSVSTAGQGEPQVGGFAVMPRQEGSNA